MGYFLTCLVSILQWILLTRSLVRSRDTCKETVPRKNTFHNTNFSLVHWNPKGWWTQACEARVRCNSPVLTTTFFTRFGTSGQGDLKACHPKMSLPDHWLGEVLILLLPVNVNHYQSQFTLEHQVANCAGWQLRFTILSDLAATAEEFIIHTGNIFSQHR